jgi:hypothetical protein
MFKITAVFILALGITFFRYAHAWYRYHTKRGENDSQQALPNYPAVIPYVGGLYQLVFNTAKFVRRAT